MGDSRFPKAFRAILNRFKKPDAAVQMEPEERARAYEAMESLPPPLFETESAPEPAPLQNSQRLRTYFEALRELAHAISSLFERDDVSHASVFSQVEKLLARKVEEVTDLAPPIMGILADSPDWRERRWAMHTLIKIARMQPEMAGTFVPGFLAHIESPVQTERELDDLANQPSRDRLAREYGFGDAVTVSFELPIPVGEHLQDVALEGLDQLAMIDPDFAQEVFPVLEALSDQPTKQGERAGKLLERLKLGEKMRRMLVTEEFLAALRDPYVIAIAKGKRFHFAHCRIARSSEGKEAYLFLNPQEAMEFGFRPCQTCQND